MNSIEAAAAPVARKQRRGVVFRHAGLKIDMTPMVDLGFLLITFFIYTAAMSDPATMNLFMPKDGPPTGVAATGALTVLIGNNGAVACYEDELKPGGANLHRVTPAQLRATLMRKKKEVMAQYIPDAACEAKAIAEKRSPEDCRQGKLMVMIKPGRNADYRSVVNVLDEMIINKIARYALMTPGTEELKYIP
ncbi:ExbD/TolR family protein [Niabella drilacis]|uniref:Biopolymer transport protein ExbD/TolR n=1 Tax=Niabella drilacis (strain DSM 25811 / CCM 8410 / CCUG 62505 / LMG 26954 / E90) TaxID=1285928 RepID=A0A1G6NPN8_NIADE|nr:biopolymer transporter ExbD [Niabella drilacis]SDC69125.1 Biopolymer transport protein ExbD/TolR [Niabella drilacis]